MTKEKFEFFTRKNEITFPKVLDPKKITMVIKVIH